jgi:hypothetical protein
MKEQGIVSTRKKKKRKEKGVISTKKCRGRKQERKEEESKETHIHMRL